MAERKPYEEPQFGDVFEINTGDRTYRAMYVAPVNDPRGDWYGVQLATVAGKPLPHVDIGDVRALVPVNRGWMKVVE